MCTQYAYIICLWVGKKLNIPSCVSPLLLYYCCSHNTSEHQMCVGFSPTNQFSDTNWVSYNLTQFWHHLHKNSFKCHRLRAQSQKTDHHFRCQLQRLGSWVTNNFCLTWLEIRDSLDLSNLIKHLTELRETFMFTSLLKNMIEDIDEQPDEQMMSGRVPSTGVSVPVEFGHVNLPVCGCVHWSDSSLTPIQLRSLWRFHHINMTDH